MDYWDYWWILALAIVLLVVRAQSAFRRRWLGMVTSRELESEKKMAGLRYEIEKLREGLYESSRRESAALLQVNELRMTVQHLMSELDTVRQAQTQLSHVVHSRRRLLLVLGADRRFNVDLAAARAVRAKTGLDFIRVHDATADKIQRHLDRARATGNAIDYMHIASHGNDKGIDLGGQLLTWDWLSGVLDGVQVLVVAACESTILADWLGVVPYVVSVSESVDNEDAGRFSQAFWMEIGRGVAPGEAYDRALARCPAQMREFVIAHW
jgi:hypothetical protein